LVIDNYQAKYLVNIYNGRWAGCWRGTEKCFAILKEQIIKVKKGHYCSENLCRQLLTHQICFIYRGATGSVGKGLLIVEDSRSHSDTPHLVGLLWTSDSLIAETSTWQYTTHTTGRHACLRRDSNPNSSKRAAADPRLRPRVHWDRHQIFLGL